MTYATAEEVQAAEALGFTCSVNTHRGHWFNKGSRRIWGVPAGWQTADIINGVYKNHRKFTDLTEALWRGDCRHA